MKMTWNIKVLFAVLSLSAGVFAQEDYCPSIDVLDPYFVDGAVECNDVGTLLFPVYEDAPTNSILFSYDEDLSRGDDCQDLLYSEGNSFGFLEVGDAESSSNERVCSRFLQNTSNPDETFSALFTFVDVNEFSPEPAGDLGVVESIEVDENTVGLILSFGYRDPDSGEASTLTCSYNFEGDAQIFSIEEGDVEDDIRNFELKTSEKLDFETNSFYSLEATFQSQDSRGNSSSTTQSFLIFVQDVGDNPPFFTTIVPFAEIPEGGPDLFVYKVEAQDRDVNINNKIFYTFHSGNEDGYFRINSTTGEVFTDKDIDREELGSPLFTLEVEATEVIDDQGTPAPGQNSTYQVTNVNIIDINDNIPTFDNNSYTETINEFDEENPTSTQSLEVIIVITDLDEGISGEYSLTTNNENVLLNPTTGSGITSVSISLQNSDDFNYEAQAGNPDIEVEITATEAADETHNSTVTLVITLLDVNDKVPTFDEPEYVTTVNETLAPGSLVLVVEATDSDVSPEFSDDFLVYEILGCEELLINGTTGFIYLSNESSLDFEEKEELQCTLQVSDMEGSSADSLSSEVSLTVAVADINDEVPVFINFVDSLTVTEGTETSTEVTTVEVSDPDTTAYLSVTLEFVDDPNHEEESWFQLVEDDSSTESHFVGKIVIATSPDREASDEVEIIVKATDLNAEEGEQLTTRTLTIMIEDINDVTPSFEDDYSNLDYDENTPEGTIVQNIQAEDPDLDDEMTFQLTDDFDYLEINSENGSISVLNKVDRETTSSFQITVSVMDLANHTESIQIQVTVNDLNDNPPELDEGICSSSYSISEDDEDGVPLTTIKATDIDEGVHAQIVYVLKNPNSVGYIYQYAPFQIDSSTGAITVNSSGDRIIDREQFAEWQLIIDAFDQCNQVEAYCQVQSDECVMSVTVQDVNDNAPGTYKLNSGTEIITDESLMEGDFIEDLEISALDPDEPNTDNSKITFDVTTMYLSDGSETEILFEALTNSRIGPENVKEFYCNLQAATNLTGLRGDYVIQIQGSDSGSPMFSSTYNFSLTIADANDMSPVFDYTDCLLESDLTIVMTENITEVGVPLNCSSDDVFGRPADIYVTDDDAPQTSNSEVDLRIDYEGSFVVEGGVDNQLEAFVIYTYPEEGRYAIAISEKIDRERGSKYNLSLIAQDQGVEPQMTYSSVSITVKDFSEFPPTFCFDAPCQQTLWIKENTNETTSFMEAEDKDNGDGQINDQIYYSIIDSDEEAFVIPDNKLPEIRPKIPLDREAQDIYNMIILASNSVSGVPPEGIENTNRVIRISVTIVDENDETPYYDDVIYGDFFDTGMKGDQVALLEFIDKDLNDTILYTFGSSFEWSNGQNYSDPFRIERIDDRTSSILLNMDPEGKSGYCTFTVNAQDEASHTSSAITEIFVVTIEYIVPFYFLNDIEDVESNKDNIEEIFTNVFNFTSIIDSIDEATNSENVPIDGETVVSAHFIREIDSEIKKIEIESLQIPSMQKGSVLSARQTENKMFLTDTTSHKDSFKTPLISNSENFLNERSYKSKNEHNSKTDIKSGTETEYELVPEVEIEEMGSQGTVASDLTTQLAILDLNLVRIGETDTGDKGDNEQTINNLKIALGAVTLFLGLTVILLLILFFVRTSKLKRQVKAMSTNAFGSKSSNLDNLGHEIEKVPGSNVYARQGANPIYNFNEKSVIDANKDTNSVSSGDSVLVGIEDNPEFEAYLAKRADLASAQDDDERYKFESSPSNEFPETLPDNFMGTTGSKKINPLLEDDFSISPSLELKARTDSSEGESTIDNQLNSQFTLK